ncbi:MAG: DsrE family protein [Thermoplasmatales archaeon]|nr:DsrE family protein [Thermoplasmatales archaeon]
MMLVLITRAPYGSEDAYAGFRAALMVSASGMKTDVLLMDDGVFNLVEEQAPADFPSNLKEIKILRGLEVEICCMKNDLEKRNIKPPEYVKIVDKISELILKNGVILTF